jgi:hypothetical protein
MLLQELKNGQNVQVSASSTNPPIHKMFGALDEIWQLYRETLELIGDKLGPPEQIRDEEWMERTQVRFSSH